jgi:hypothetical protein
MQLSLHRMAPPIDLEPRSYQVVAMIGKFLENFDKLRELVVMIGKVSSHQNVKKKVKTNLKLLDEAKSNRVLKYVYT